MFTGFELIEVGRLDYGQLLSSQVPEVVVLAVLADFKKERPPRSSVSPLRLPHLQHLPELRLRQRHNRQPANAHQRHLL